MFEVMRNFFLSGFVYPGLLWNQALLGIGLGIAFGAVWFLPYWTPVLKRPAVWAILAFSTFFTWMAVALVQIPLQLWTGQALNYFWNQEVIMSWLLLAGIPQILLSGLVQEGAKLVPIVFYWWRNDRNIDPKLGLAIGAAAGLGFGVFEAVWVHNRIFASGWTLELLQSGGLIMLAGFWERFFTVALHIGFSALAGYGLAKGRGWQFYLLAAFLHSLANYGAVLLAAGIVTVIQVEVYVAVIAVLVTSGALWLRWKRTT